MSELHAPHRLLTRRLPKVEMTRQFLEDSIFTIEFHLEKARIDNNQKTAEVYSDLLMKMRQMLCELPVKASQS